MVERIATSDVLLKEFICIHGSRVGQKAPSAHAGAFGALKAKWENRSPLNPDSADFAKDERTRMVEYCTAVHALAEGSPDGQTALCLSGGGIRSAAFALGVMQGLAEQELLSRFHYLSTVSGGGYIGSWLTAWARRPHEEPRGPAGGEQNDQASRKSKTPTFAEIEKALADPAGAEPLKELRRRQDFLTPRVGVASPDSWAALAHVARNLLLNWLVFVPMLAALLLLPRIVEAGLALWVATTPSSIDSSLLDLARLLYPWVPAATLPISPRSWLDSVAMALVAIGLAFSMANRSIRSSAAISDKTFKLYVLAPVVLGALLLVAATSAWYRDSHVPNWAECLQWGVLCAVVFPLIRLVAAAYTRLKGFSTDNRRLAPELFAQAVAGALVGVLIWAGVKMHHHYVMSQPADPQGAMHIALRDVAVFGVPWFLMSFLVGQAVLSGLTSYLFRENGDRNREWLARAVGWYGAVSLGWLAVSWVVLYGWGELSQYHRAFPSLTLGTGAATLLAGASPLTKAVSASGLAKNMRASTAVSVLSAVFILCLMVLLAHATILVLQQVVDLPPLHPATLPVPLEGGLKSTQGGVQGQEASYRFVAVLVAAVALLLFSLVASYFVNVNYFSLNALYRNRLVRAFLGSSNIKPVTGKDPDRNPFDGFAEADNIAMADLAAEPTDAPFPVINMTLNLTATQDNAWQERKAAPFVSTPLHTGGDLVGYRPSKDYAAGPKAAGVSATVGISLGTAMSISGAAASPNWGYHSSPVTSFLLALFNIRLGCWLGNPRSEETWRSDGPEWAPELFWQEALGHTSDRSRYVYLSDGGHFENLGLYEMVRRRCHVIVVSDAGADPGCTLEDLGNAMRKAFIDLAVEIKFGPMHVSKRGQDGSNPGIYCAVGRITYPKGENAPEGTIIYIKPGLYSDAPADVRAYAAANAKFPHDTTLNQWFTESQFESYRALGQHSIRMIASRRDDQGVVQPGGRVQDLAALAARAADYASGYATRSVPPTRVSLVS